MYRRLSFEEIYRNPWVTVERHRMVHPNGVPGEHVLIVVPAAAGIVVLDGDDVLLARQPRFGADAEMLEIVKGGTNAGERTIDAARRETREELGILAERWDELGVAWEIPSIMKRPVELFLARDVSVAASEQEDVEAIALQRVPLRAALDLALHGGLDDAVTISALIRAAALLGLLNVG